MPGTDSCQNQRRRTSPQRSTSLQLFLIVLLIRTTFADFGAFLSEDVRDTRAILTISSQQVTGDSANENSPADGFSTNPQTTESRVSKETQVSDVVPLQTVVFDGGKTTGRLASTRTTFGNNSSDVVSTVDILHIQETSTQNTPSTVKNGSYQAINVPAVNDGIYRNTLSDGSANLDTTVGNAEERVPMSTENHFPVSPPAVPTSGTATVSNHVGSPPQKILRRFNIPSLEHELQPASDSDKGRSEHSESFLRTPVVVTRENINDHAIQTLLREMASIPSTSTITTVKHRINSSYISETTTQKHQNDIPTTTTSFSSTIKAKSNASRSNFWKDNKTIKSPDLSQENANISAFIEAFRTAHPDQQEIAQNPFIVVWNIPSKQCGTKQGVLPKLSKYGIIHNKHQHFYGDKIVIFYAKHLGFYPRIVEDGHVINGGIPQLANIDIHLAKARSDIEKRIPNVNFTGYAVIDWESWRPIFRRNWGRHRMYKDRAIKMIAKNFPSWNYTTVKAYAKKEFDISARKFIMRTLSLAKAIRPRAKWGFYLFPDCYNFRNGQDYCDRKQTKRNDRLHWMFKASGALYPSIYLTQRMSPKYRAGHIKGILYEAYRIQKTHTNRWKTPVLPYARLRYGDTDFLMSREDLEGTIGQAATTGSAGIILWERYINTVGKRKCVQLQKYVHKILGPYLKIVQSFVASCSKNLCEGRGRCVRKRAFFAKQKKQHYKHRFVSMFSKYKASYHKAFRCSCYGGWWGARCENKKS